MITLLLGHFGKACTGGGLFGFPTWYKYLDSETLTGGCSPKVAGINDIWLIVAAVIEIMLRLAAIVAVVYIIWAGFEYLTSQAEPAKLTKARQTLISALVGLVIAILATAVVNFIAGSVN